MSVLWLILVLLPVFGGAERFSCRGRILGAYYADAKSGCKAFHVCVRVAGGGIRDFRFFCPPGTLFHQEAQTCTDWGDDDPLACPADLYDGSFDLYKIGSGFDTKKLSVNNNINNRDDEAEFGLQRAETGDKRLSQGVAPSGPASDLKASHSSDFFSGQRERGRDDAHPGHAPASSTSLRQSYRSRPTTRAPPSPSTQYTTVPEPPPSKRPQYDTKRKLVRKRPVYYSSTASPNSFVQSSQNPRQFYADQNEQKFRAAENERTTLTPANVPPQYKDEYVEVPRVTPKPRASTASVSPTAFAQSTPVQRQTKKEGLSELYNFDSQSTPVYNNAPSDRPFKVRNNFNVANEVSRTPDYSRKNINVSPNGLRGTQNTPDYNSAATSTPSHRNFNSVSYEPEKNNFVNYPTSKQNYYNSPSTTPATTAFTTARHEPPPNLNTVAYNTNIGFNALPINYPESEEDDGQYRLPDGEDDGQYRPELYERERKREKELDRDRELLSGAHSLNIAASGNRLPDDQKPRTKPTTSQTSAPRPFRPAPTPTAPPSPSPRAPEATPTTAARPQTFSTQRTFDYYQTYTTTARPEVKQNSQYFNKAPVREPSPTVAAPRLEPRQQQTRAPAPLQQSRSPPTAPVSTRAPAPPSAPAQTRAPAPPTIAPAPRPTTRQPSFAKPASNKEDNSYDYAYYDSDPGFSEYDQIEEFGKTKSRV